MSLVRKALSGAAGVVLAGAVNKVAHRAMVSRTPGYKALSRVGLGKVASRRAPSTVREQVMAAVAGLVGTAVVNRLLRRR